jgi:hypothetical protein
MIVWGGAQIGVGYTNTGGVYDPATNSWTATSTTGAPGPRHVHTAVWTGSKMIVWGGWNNGFGYANTGGIYDPATDSWKATSTTGASPRNYHTAVWTGSKMIVWGGETSAVTNTGGVYDPATDTWAASSTTGAPSPRESHTAVWTGSRMIVWGGDAPYPSRTDTGGVYDLTTDSWTFTSSAGPPAPRDSHTAVWAPPAMIVWGGTTGSLADTGGVYGPPPLALLPADFHTVTPCRVVDTRDPAGPWGGPILGAFSTRTFPVTGTCSIPSTAVAVSVNLTAVGAAAAGNLVLYPGYSISPPLASSLNFAAGVTRANNAVVLLALNGAGTLEVKNSSAGAVHFVLDVNGYFQ